MIAEETVGVDPEAGRGGARVITDRRARAPEPLVSNSMLSVRAICDEAFAEVQDGMCARRQIASILKQDLGEICHQLTQISHELYGNTEEGATPRMILEFCRRREYGCVLVRNEEVVETLAGHPILAFAAHEDHCFFYRDSSVRKALAERRSGEPTARLQEARRQTQTPPASECIPGSSR